PRPPGVVRDEQRRFRVDDGDDRRTGAGGRDDPRQRHGGPPRRLERPLDRHHLLRLEVDLVDAAERRHARDHRARPDRRSATTPAARRAAPPGEWPLARPATYAAAKASPAPVVSAPGGA